MSDSKPPDSKILTAKYLQLDDPLYLPDYEISPAFYSDENRSMARDNSISFFIEDLKNQDYNRTLS